MEKPVGLVGVGAMGQALLHRLHLIGRQVRTFDVSQQCQDIAREAGAEPAASAAAAAEGAEFVHVFVRTDEEVIEANLGPGGVIEGAAPGAVLFQHATVLPETTRRVAEAAAEKGIRVLDAPVTAIPRRVHAGEALFLVGGPEDVVSETGPYLESLGRGMVHFGPIGAGNVAKIAKNFANAGERILLSEILAMVEAGGLDPIQFLDMAAQEDSGTLIAHWDRGFIIEDGHAVPKRATNLINKDVRLAAELAESYKLDTPLTQGSARTAAQWVRSWEKEA